MSLKNGKSIFDDFVATDPTWARARDIASRQLKLPSHVPQLIKGSWFGQVEGDDFIKVLSFSKLNPRCLFDAAEMKDEDVDFNAETLKHAVNFLGARLSGVVLAINLTCRMILKTQPTSLWKNLLEEMITNIEIGYKLGAKTMELGCEGGALIGFAKSAGLGLLMADNFKLYKKWHSMTGGYENRELQIELFGCEPYQTSAFALQHLGFGPEIAIGCALGTGKLNPQHLELDRSHLRWKAAYLWIESLREGRSYPATPEMRNFFKELRPPANSKEKNLNLEVLYTEVAKVKREGSDWTWHLPRPGYDETIEYMGLR